MKETLSEYFSHFRNVRGLHVNMITAGVTTAIAVRHVFNTLLPSVFMSDLDRSFTRTSIEVIPLLLQESGYFHLQATKPNTIGK